MARKQHSVYVVAVSKEEALSLPPECRHANKREAVKHLAEVRAPPTDPVYGNKYRVYEIVEVQE